MTAAVRRSPETSNVGTPTEANPPSSSADITPLRLKELRRLFRRWFGTRFADDDRCRKLMAILLAHIATLRTNVEQLMDAAIDEWAPWMAPGERDRFKDRARTSQSTWTADELAAALPLTFAERTALQIKTIGAVDLDKAAREELRAQKHRERQRQRRHKERAQSKIPPSTWARTIAVLDLLPPKAEVPVKWLRQRLDGSKEFLGVSLKPAIHRTIKQLEEKGLVRVRTPNGRMAAMWVGRRSSEGPADIQAGVEDVEGAALAPLRLSVPATPEEYRLYLIEKLQSFTRENVASLARWYYSEEEYGLRHACGIGPEPADHEQFMVLARARKLELTGDGISNGADRR